MDPNLLRSKLGQIAKWVEESRDYVEMWEGRSTVPSKVGEFKRPTDMQTIAETEDEYIDDDEPWQAAWASAYNRGAPSAVLTPPASLLGLESATSTFASEVIEGHRGWEEKAKEVLKAQDHFFKTQESNFPSQNPQLMERLNKLKSLHTLKDVNDTITALHVVIVITNRVNYAYPNSHTLGRVCELGHVSLNSMLSDKSVNQVQIHHQSQILIVSKQCKQ